MHKTNRIASSISGNSKTTITSEISAIASSSGFTTFSESKINGRKALSLLYRSKGAEALAGYSLIQKDLKFCKNILTTAIDLCGGNLSSKDSLYVRESIDMNADLLKAMTISFIITYGKCYTQANGRKITLNHKDIFKNESTLRIIHDNLIDIRNNYVAHAGNTSLEVATITILLDADEQSTESPKVIANTNHMYATDQTLYEAWLDIICFVEIKLKDMMEKKLKYLNETELKDIPRSYLYKLARDGKPLVFK